MGCETCDTDIPAGRSDCPTCYTPVGAPAVLPGVKIHSVWTFGLAATAAVALAMLADAAVLLSPVIGLQLARRAERDLDPAALDQAAVLEAVLAFGQTAIVLVAAVLVIIWCYRVRDNLDAFAGSAPELRTGWAIGGWFVPFANLVIPFRVMADVARVSLFRAGTPGLVWGWWLSFVVYVWGGQAVSRYDLGQFTELPLPIDPADFAAHVDYYQQALFRNSVVLVAGVLAAVTFGLLAVRVSRAQEARIARGAPRGPVMPGMAVPAP
ncbi:DUF4328 domain-containing protein [Plantactinospora sp. B24E8]|uniref:DUF4328 domain-containing protein n=1 Tax=Plantactinospora sp. B24E8 TaxID=3153567 RepID=UPI00325C4BA7